MQRTYFIRETVSLTVFFNPGLEARGVLIYFSVRGRAAEQGLIFRISIPGQGIIFVKIGSMTGSIFVIFDSKRSFKAICTLRM